MSSITPPYLPKDYFSIENTSQFLSLALAAFNYQYTYNKVYKLFCGYLNVKPDSVKTLNDIPFLPIELFKQQRIVTGIKPDMKIFCSSGTTGATTSKHCLIDEDIYQLTLIEGFKRVFGNPSKYSFLALLPGYLERSDSSLVYMVNELMKKSNMKNNRFFMEADEDLIAAIKYNQQNEINTILFGVSFSLLEFATKNPISLERVNLIETGGMKGKMEEKTRAELHALFKEKFNLQHIYSEYGMTELLSQAYAVNGEIFETPPWMHIMIRETNDPLNEAEIGKAGGINIIDLANINSCCFISTQDLGKKNSPNTFEVLGRFDNADIRGCNLLFG